MKKWIEKHGHTVGMFIIIATILVVMMYVMGYENLICPYCS